MFEIWRSGKWWHLYDNSPAHNVLSVFEEEWPNLSTLFISPNESPQWTAFFYVEEVKKNMKTRKANKGYCSSRISLTSGKRIWIDAWLQMETILWVIKFWTINNKYNFVLQDSVFFRVPYRISFSFRKMSVFLFTLFWGDVLTYSDYNAWLIECKINKPNRTICVHTTLI